MPTAYHKTAPLRKDICRKVDKKGRGGYTPRVPKILHLLLPAAALLGGCRQCIDWTNNKQMDPGVEAMAAQPGSFFCYLKDKEPGFCLVTRRAMIWDMPGWNLGYWRGLHPKPPHRVLMEARGDTLILHRKFVWDGMTYGTTRPRDVLPTLLHDVQYHSLKAGSRISRRTADRIFICQEKEAGTRACWLGYILLRTFGGLFAKPADPPTMLIEWTTPDTPPAPVEQDDGKPVKGW